MKLTEEIDAIEQRLVEDKLEGFRFSAVVAGLCFSGLALCWLIAWGVMP